VRPSTPTRPPEAGGESLGVFGEPLTSPQNALVKRAASLHQRKFRDREGAFLAEGADVVAAALAAGWRPQAVFLREEAADELGERLGLMPGAGGERDSGPAPSVFPVSERVAARISTLESPPEVLAVLPLPARRPLSSLLGPASGPKTAALRRAAGEAAAAGDGAGLLVVYVDGVQDPGNVGTLLRAAAAFGASAVVTSTTTADPYGPKTVRASMGALFALPVFPALPPADVTDQLPAATVYGLAAHGGAPLAAAELRRPAVLVVGAERAGLSPAALAHVDQLVTIPLPAASSGGVESLNAGVAGAIALYEFSRRPAGAPEDPSRRAPAAQEG
jgi:RNA methyltransferase, TrmH family